MKQIIQNLKTGETILEEIPRPEIKKGHLLIKTHRSLVSAGTEKMLVEFGKSSLISKARQQPEKVNQVLDKIKADGLLPTLEAVFNKLEEPLPLGYCNAGEVIGVGEGVENFKVGDRVASNGPHAEIVSVPKNLVAKIPDNVSYEEASFTVIGAIGLQGIRLASPTLGETVVVSGLGLIGLITSELLKANGCKVIGFDVDENKIQLAKQKGFQAFNPSYTDPVKTVLELTSDIGADAVIITASTKGNELISQAAKMSRKRGRIILVGVIGLELNRSDFYEKELSFQVSCSYGPGRYDEEYEKKGIDYPLPFVRWTEKRNFETILNSIANGSIDVKSLITEVIELDNFQKIYRHIGENNSIASILKYKESISLDTSISLKTNITNPTKGKISVIGAGNFTKMIMMPVLKKINANIRYIVSAGGVSGTYLAKKYKAEYSSTNFEDALKDKETDALIITTRHHLHANMLMKGIKAGKHVFVEKPLAIFESELEEIEKLIKDSHTSLTVGFNRRFSPFIIKAKNILGNPSEPVNITMNINAGFIPANHWVHDRNIGGGRIIGEACHFIDLAGFIAASKAAEVMSSALTKEIKEASDNVSIIVKYENGSQAVINYFSNGHKSYSKEKIEIYSQGRILIIDNFRKMKGYGCRNFSSMSNSQDKGHKEQFKKYLEFLISGGKPIIPADEIINSTKASFAAVRSLKSHQWEKV
ncbi:MAG: bi-domain-containing oxidoreductase [Cytophagaceae bacterium]|nr:bi-domain-containing oxidoreductase [Cytophagaceae bacterium]